MAKMCKFDSFRDPRLKNALYEISLHQTLNRNQLVDYFIMSRGTLHAIVMIFRYFENTLLDLVNYRKAAQSYGWNEG